MGFFDLFNRKKRIAVLVDGPNIIRKAFNVDLNDARKELSKYGEIRVAKVYLDQYASPKLQEAMANQGFDITQTTGDVDVTIVHARKLEDEELVKKLVDAGLDQNAKRMVLSGAIHGLESDIWTKLPFLFEIKNHERVKLWEFWDQTKLQAVDSRKTPVLAVKSNRRDFLVVMEVNDWLELAWHALKSDYGK